MHEEKVVDIIKELLSSCNVEELTELAEIICNEIKRKLEEKVDLDANENQSPQIKILDETEFMELLNPSENKVIKIDQNSLDSSKSISECYEESQEENQEEIIIGDIELDVFENKDGSPKVKVQSCQVNLDVSKSKTDCNEKSQEENQQENQEEIEVSKSKTDCDDKVQEDLQKDLNMTEFEGNVDPLDLEGLLKVTNPKTFALYKSTWLDFVAFAKITQDEAPTEKDYHSYFTMKRTKGKSGNYITCIYSHLNKCHTYIYGEKLGVCQTILILLGFGIDYFLYSRNGLVCNL